jgi:FkbM family methyltransferase
VTVDSTSPPLTARVRWSARYGYARFKAGLWWQYKVRRRLAGRQWFADRLPWAIWCHLCAWDAGGVIRELARRRGSPMRFVQIGSNQGVANDPLHETIRTYRWSGVLVEPLPHLFDQLVRNYDGVPGLSFRNVAVASQEGHITMYLVDRRPDDPEWVTQIASLDRDHVVKHAYAIPDVEDRIHAVDVECLPLSALVKQEGLEHIDLLHTDVEGYDHELIAQIPADAPWAPDYLLFEAKHMDLDALARTKRYLKESDYRVLDLWPDALAYRGAPGRRP